MKFVSLDIPKEAAKEEDGALEAGGCVLPEPPPQPMSSASVNRLAMLAKLRAISCRGDFKFWLGSVISV